MTVVRRACTLLVFVGLLVASCDETKEIGPERLGYEFYPIKTGQYRIYEVEEVDFKITGFDTLTYQLRETIYDSIESIDQVTYLIRRDTRNTQADEWQSVAVWSVTQVRTYLSVTENGMPYMKLTFPVDVGNEWNGNSLNSDSEQTYYYQSVEQSLIDTIATEDHIRVVIEDIVPNVTGVDLRNEVYAKGIGLVEKDYLTQETCTASSCGDALGEVVAGRSLKQILIEVGDE